MKRCRLAVPLYQTSDPAMKPLYPASRILTPKLAAAPTISCLLICCLPTCLFYRVCIRATDAFFINLRLENNTLGLIVVENVIRCLILCAKHRQGCLPSRHLQDIFALPLARQHISFIDHCRSLSNLWGAHIVKASKEDPRILPWHIIPYRGGTQLLPAPASWVRVSLKKS